MELYSLLREFADSWMLVVMMLVFVGVIYWAFRPGSRPVHDDAASSIFRNEHKPAPVQPATPAPSKEART